MKLVYRKCDNSLISDMLPGFLHLDRGSWVAGGAARCLWFSQESRLRSTASDGYKQDIDVFCKNPEQQQEIQAYVQNRYLASTLVDPDITQIEIWKSPDVYVSNNATTFRNCKKTHDEFYSVQIIKRCQESLIQLLESFDFYNCQFATNGIWMVASKAAIASWENNTIMVNEQYQGEIKIARILKYCIYGLNPTRELWQDILNKSLATRKSGWNYDYQA